MKKPLLFLTSLLIAVCTSSAAEDNKRLQELEVSDQADRKHIEGRAIDWDVVRPRDADRRSQVLALLRRGGVHTAADYANAAMIFQHGDSTDDIRIAYSLATLAIAMDPTSTSGRFLSAASWDRILVREGKPQWYGTQYRRGATGKMEIYPVDESAVTDEQRRQLGLPSLKAAREHMPGN